MCVRDSKNISIPTGIMIFTDQRLGQKKNWLLDMLQNTVSKMQNKHV